VSTLHLQTVILRSADFTTLYIPLVFRCRVIYSQSINATLQACDTTCVSSARPCVGRHSKETSTYTSSSKVADTAYLVSNDSAISSYGRKCYREYCDPTANRSLSGSGQRNRHGPSSQYSIIYKTDPRPGTIAVEPAIIGLKSNTSKKQRRRVFCNMLTGHADCSRSKAAASEGH
jgi:hypothetical protein